MAQHGEAFIKLKETIANAPVLKYYNPEEELTVQCDASDSVWVQHSCRRVNVLPSQAEHSYRVRLCTKRKYVFGINDFWPGTQRHRPNSACWDITTLTLYYIIHFSKNFVLLLSTHLALASKLKHCGCQIFCIFSLQKRITCKPLD